MAEKRTRDEAEEIDLNEAEEAALERAWAELGPQFLAERAARQTKQREADADGDLFSDEGADADE